MSMRGIPWAEWQSFVEQFSRDHRGWLATVSRATANGSRHVDAHQRPLRSVTTTATGPEIATIAIHLHRDLQPEEVIHVENASRLVVDETPEGAPHALEIESTGGDRVRIQLRGAVPPGILDGLAPGEL
jgi:hypothetical protein